MRIMMEVVTKKQLCKDVAKRWKGQYFTGHSLETREWSTIHDVKFDRRFYKSDHKISAEVIYDNLVALGGEGSPKQIADIIGNDVWTKITCDECGKSVDVAVYLGEELDHDSATALVCLPCLMKAIRLGEEEGEIE